MVNHSARVREIDTFDRFGLHGRDDVRAQHSAVLEIVCSNREPTLGIGNAGSRAGAGAIKRYAGSFDWLFLVVHRAGHLNALRANIATPNQGNHHREEKVSQRSIILSG